MFLLYFKPFRWSPWYWTLLQSLPLVPFLCDSAHITEGSVITRLSLTVVIHSLITDKTDPQLLYLTHWANMKCFLIIHLITESHNLRLWSQGNSNDSAPFPLSQMSDHIKVSLATTRPTRWAKGQKKSEEDRYIGMYRELWPVCFYDVVRDDS